jgi:hypothetical protein
LVHDLLLLLTFGSQENSAHSSSFGANLPWLPKRGPRHFTERLRKFYRPADDIYLTKSNHAARRQKNKEGCGAVCLLAMPFRGASCCAPVKETAGQIFSGVLLAVTRFKVTHKVAQGLRTFYWHGVKERGSQTAHCAMPLQTNQPSFLSFMPNAE